MNSIAGRFDKSAILFWSGLILAPLPLLVVYFMQLWTLEQYQYFPVLFLALGMLFFARWDRVPEGPKSWFAWGLIAAGALATLVGAVKWSPWAGCLGFVLFLGAFLVSQSGLRPTQWGLMHLWPATWMLLRPPLNLDYQLTTWLQAVTARVSSHLLDHLGVIHRLSGNVFYLPKGTLFVEAACSGVQSLFSLLFCAILLVVWQYRSAILLPLYAIVAVFFAGVMNIVRVTVIAIAQEWWRLDLAHGWKHEVLGYVCLFVAILLLLSCDRLFRVLFFPVPTDASEARLYNPLELFWNRQMASMAVGETTVAKPTRAQPLGMTRLGLGLACALVPILILPQLVYGYAAWKAVPAGKQARYWEPSKDIFQALPSTVSVVDYSVSKDASNPALGEHAHMWVLKGPDFISRVVASQHAEIHDLCACYRGNGWQIDDRALIENENGKAQQWDTVAAKFVNSETVFGYLYFSTMDRQARPVKLRGWSVSDFFLQRVDRGDQPMQSGFDGETINIQLWTTSETPLTDSTLEELRELHQQVREIIRNDLSGTK